MDLGMFIWLLSTLDHHNEVHLHKQYTSLGITILSAYRASYRNEWCGPDIKPTKSSWDCKEIESTCNV